MNLTENCTVPVTTPVQTKQTLPNTVDMEETKIPVTWYNGKHVLEIDFCEEFLAENPMHYIDGTFYNMDGAVSDGTIEKKISDKLYEARVQKKFAQTVRALMDALRRICFVADYRLPDNEIHLNNGYLKTNGLSILK